MARSCAAANDSRFFNHSNLYLPSSGLGGTPGGAPISNGTITSTFEPRILQFGLKFGSPARLPHFSH
jgi:hypothetical protein